MIVGSTFSIRWRGLEAVYTPGERQIIRQLPVKEQAFVHLLKALTAGQVADKRVPGDATVELLAPPVVYTDPEDIPFGKLLSKPDKRGKKTYAVVWSWRKHRIHKTKKRCEERLKVWKRWYERQGWNVSRLGSGYVAELDGERHIIQLHEYDRETNERLP